MEQLEHLLLDRARTELAAQAAIAVEGTRLILTGLAVEEPALENVIGPSDVAALACLEAALPMSARDTAGRWRSVLDDWRSAGALLPEPVTVAAALVLLNDVSCTPEATIRLTAVALGVGLADRLLRFPCVMTADGARVVPPTAGSLRALLLAPSALAEQLRSALGRAGGLGPQKFLGLLGAERAPRLITHPQLYERFASERRRGLGVGATGSPVQRARELRAVGATYTLDDLDSPDLRAVAFNIAKERKASRRRTRAGALLATLGRAWDRLEEGSEVDAAQDYYSWQIKGSTRAFWLWSVGAIAWLDDTDGVPRAPLDLRLKTAGTIAVHGADAAGYLRPEFDAPNRREILAALGVAGEPSTRDLVDRLRRLRDTTPAPDSMATDAAIVYQALADRLASRTVVPGDLSDRDLRSAFGDGGGLVYTELGWRRPTEVLVGSPVFRRRRAFVPQVSRAERLWTMLRIRRPSLDDCLTVIGQVARTRRPPEGDDVVVVLETLRLLAALVAATPDLNRRVNRRLSNLALFTTRGWTNERPVYAIDDPALIEGLRAEVPVWDPGVRYPTSRAPTPGPRFASSSILFTNSP